MQIFVANFDKILRKVCKAQFIKFAMVSLSQFSDKFTREQI